MKGERMSLIYHDYMDAYYVNDDDDETVMK